MHYININNDKLRDLMEDTDNTILIDVRSKEEFEEVKIKKSINIPLNELMYNVSDIEEYREKNIIIYCRSGHRSITACNLLSIEGFRNVYNLERGIIAYDFK